MNHSPSLAPVTRRRRLHRLAPFALCAVLAATLAGCGGNDSWYAESGSSASGTTGGTGGSTGSGTTTGPLATTDNLTGAIDFIHDPAVLRQGSTWYVYSTDASSTQGGYIPVRCSTDKTAFTDCGYVFPTMPSWVASAVPLATEIWAPDVSYFNGLYHLYYAVSSFGSNVSAIGMATNTTLDPTDPAYAWVDHGPVLQSTSTDGFNAIDPSIVVDASGHVWLSYGSFWTGIYQQQIDPATGQVLAGGNTYHLAERASSVTYDPVEGANVVMKGAYFYLFVSWDFCCTSPAASATYKIAVGRSSSPNGPFLDEAGVDLAAGGGTVLLAGNSLYSAPGGATVAIDATDGDTIVFHALDLSRNGVPVLFMKSLTWSSDGWPVIGD